ncbi:hypothetical protein DFS33DRAFT_1065010 [Desarmillaria ectypa]|nr:hypothetical protein DFS33DRAFT_1065010 [Desarmillaria ectypa]
MVPKKETALPHTTISYLRTLSPMLTATDTSTSFTFDSSDIILQVDLGLALPDSDTSCSSDIVLPDRPQRAAAISSLLLSIPPEILPKAIRSLTTWRLQELRAAPPNATVLVRMAEALDSIQPGRRVKWISKEYYDELERERGREHDSGSRITEVDDKVNDGDQHDAEHSEKDALPGEYDHLDSSQLRRDCSACRVPRDRLSVTSIPTIKPVPTKAIPTKVPISTTLTAKSKPKPKAAAKPKPRCPIADSENIPPPQAQTRPRRRPAMGKSRIPAPRVFGLHNA